MLYMHTQALKWVAYPQLGKLPMPCTSSKKRWEKNPPPPQVNTMCGARSLHDSQNENQSPYKTIHYIQGLLISKPIETHWKNPHFCTYTNKHSFAYTTRYAWAYGNHTNKAGVQNCIHKCITTSLLNTRSLDINFIPHMLHSKWDSTSVNSSVPSLLLIWYQLK